MDNCKHVWQIPAMCSSTHCKISTDGSDRFTAKCFANNRNEEGVKRVSIHLFIPFSTFPSVNLLITLFINLLLNDLIVLLISIRHFVKYSFVQIIESSW